MTDTEDMLLERLSGSAKLLLLWQALAVFTCWILTGTTPWFWIPASCSLLAVALSAVEILWTIPCRRRQVWEQGGWRCRRCEAGVEGGRCACTESPSPWETNATSEGSPPSRLETKQERNGDSLH